MKTWSDFSDVVNSTVYIKEISASYNDKDGESVFTEILVRNKNMLFGDVVTTVEMSSKYLEDCNLDHKAAKLTFNVAFNGDDGVVSIAYVVDFNTEDEVCCFSSKLESIGL